MKNNTIKPFKNLSNTDPIETSSIHHNTNNKEKKSGGAVLTELVTAGSILGVFSYHFAPETLTTFLLPLGTIITAASAFLLYKD